MNWKIFIITHGPIIDEYYKNDPLFSNDHFTFFNVSDQTIINNNFIIINKSEQANFINLGKWYAEAEVIFNIYKSSIYKGLDYVGFIHWDFDLKSENPKIGHQFSSKIEELTDANESFISFSTFDFDWDYNQKILMDLKYPNQLVGEGKNCYHTIINDYNNFYHTNITLNSLIGRKINLCSAFLCKVSIFEELMPFYCSVIESKKLDKFDTAHKYRFQGGMMERYVACFSHQFDFFELPLHHRYNQENYIRIEENKNRTFKKIIYYLRRFKRLLFDGK